MGGFVVIAVWFSRRKSGVRMSGDNLAVYAGTFDPITTGHLDIIERASALFGKLIVAVAENPYKDTMLSPQQRVELVSISAAKMTDRVEVQSFDGLLVNFVKARGAKIIVRGLRAVSDYEYESQMAVINRNLNSDIGDCFFDVVRALFFY